MRYVILSIFSSLVGSPQAGNTRRCAVRLRDPERWDQMVKSAWQKDSFFREKRKKKIILLIRILRRAVCSTVPRIYLHHLASRIAAYLQVEAPARHPQFIRRRHLHLRDYGYAAVSTYSSHACCTRSQDRGILLYQFILDRDVSFYFPPPSVSSTFYRFFGPYRVFHARGLIYASFDSTVC